MGSPPGCKCWLGCGDVGAEASKTVESRPSGSVAASVERVRREFLRGIVGARLGGPLCVTLDARDPILLGSSIPPPVSMGPSIGGT